MKRLFDFPLYFRMQSYYNDAGTRKGSSWHTMQYIPTFDEGYVEAPAGYTAFLVEYKFIIENPTSSTGNDPGYAQGDILAVRNNLLGYTGEVNSFSSQYESNYCLKLNTTTGEFEPCPSAVKIDNVGGSSASMSVIDRVAEYENAYTEYTDTVNLLDKLNSANTKIDATNTKLDSTNLKLDSELALTEGIRGAVVDVKNQPEDACIIRIYVGDQTKKREAAATEIERLLGEGYRPYQTFGISEDLARVLFVKYPEPNDANVEVNP